MPIIKRRRKKYAGYTATRPRELSEADYLAWMMASSDRTVPLSKPEFSILLDQLKKSDPVRIWRIQRDIKWIRKKAAQYGRMV